jgi:uncharacterized protein YqjF (DUF2071 family)
MTASHLLQRHPVAMQATFEHVLVLTYALPASTLQPLLPPGLSLDTFQEYGFLAIAMVQTRGMRPRLAPQLLGRDFFLTGYRVFTRYRTRSGRVLRGLRILRSDTDSATMVRWGNRLTHYSYRLAAVTCCAADNSLEIDIRTPDAEADLHVRAHLGAASAALPEGSPFPDLRTARRFAGPLPFTFDYEPETHSIIRIQGVRDKWNPQPVRVEVFRNTFLSRDPFFSAHPVLASAFHLANVPYRWKRGIREPLES